LKPVGSADFGCQPELQFRADKPKTPVLSDA
jgi:hypothetical protein